MIFEATTSVGHLECGGLSSLSFSRQAGGGAKPAIRSGLKSKAMTSHRTPNVPAARGACPTLLRQEKNLPQHRNTRRKSFDIGRCSATENDASRYAANEKCSVAAKAATKPQQTRNTPQQTATNRNTYGPREGSTLRSTKWSTPRSTRRSTRQSTEGRQTSRSPYDGPGEAIASSRPTGSTASPGPSYASMPENPNSLLKK